MKLSVWRQGNADLTLRAHASGVNLLAAGKAARHYFKGDLKPPTNIKARTVAKSLAAFYDPLAAG